MSSSRFLSLAKCVWLVVACKLTAISLFFAGYPLVAVALFFALDPWFFYQWLAPGARQFFPIVNSFETPRREVWLTIDDGPDPETTPAILDLLDAHRAHATFFVIGQKARQYPQLIAEIARRGHEVANHTDSHRCISFWWASSARVAGELDRCATAIRAAGVEPAPWFRPPVGIKSICMGQPLSARGLTTVMWNARGYDGVSHDAQRVVERIRRRLKPGTVILMHEGGCGVANPSTLEGLLQQLDRDGYTCVRPDPASLR